MQCNRFAFIFVSILIGEFIAPISEQAAQQKRSVALTEQIAMKTKHGFWSRDGDSYINIRKILPNVLSHMTKYWRNKNG